jgi:bifunctional ADP-heptose synthase (sugar kinase/adenylyltransferase)
MVHDPAMPHHPESWLSRRDLESLLAALPRKRIGVLGDFCLDVYWEHDLTASELSVETRLPTHPVRTQQNELGGAGAIVNNLAAMGVGSVQAFGVIGPDLFGAEMGRLLAARGVDPAGLLHQRDDFQSLVYIKPLRDGRELNRIDFGNFNRLHDRTAAELLASLERALPSLDAVIINEQVTQGIHTTFLQNGLNDLLARYSGRTVIADCRHLAGVYAHCQIRVNEIEATRLCGGSHHYGDTVARKEAMEAATQLYERRKKPVFVSRGPHGVLVADEDGLHAVPGLRIAGPTDPVGAGDSMLAGIAAALAGGCTPLQAGVFGNLVAGVTVQKLFQTGTATPAELLALGAHPAYKSEPAD